MATEQVAPPGGTFTPASAEADGFTGRYFEAGAGQPVVRVHGAGGPLFSYDLDDLAHANRVIELELPGFGDSPVNERTDGAASMADTVAAVIKALGIAPVHVWGTSMGGVVSAHLAARHPCKPSSPPTSPSSAPKGPNSRSATKPCPGDRTGARMEVPPRRGAAVGCGPG